MHLVPNTDTVPETVNRYLLPHERQVITVHFHPAVLLGPVGLALAGLGGAVAASVSSFSSDAMLVIWLVWVLLLLYAIGRTLRWLVDYFVVTLERMVMVTGVFTRDVVSVPMVHATRIKLRRSILGRIIGYGQFIIEADRIQPGWTARYMPYPEQLYLEITGLAFPDVSTDADPDPRSPLPDVPQVDPQEWLLSQHSADEVHPEHRGRDEDEQGGP